MHALCQIDRQSLIDLGIIPDAAGEWPLRHLLDHTRSDAAHRKLIVLLSSPLRSTAEIVARQQLLSALPDIDAAFDWREVYALLRQTAAYLDSNYVVIPTTTFDATLLLVRYKDIAKAIEANMLAVESLLDICATLHERASTCPSDAPFRHLMQDLQCVLDTTIRSELRNARSRTTGRRLALCLLDSRIRVDLREHMQALIDAVHTADAYCALSRTSRLSSLCRPVIAEHDGLLELDAVAHPAVTGAQVNSFAQDNERVLFVTGPNMSGKSTLLRAIGICVVFAHLGLNVPARRATVPLCDRVISSLRSEDSLSRGESTYLTEVRRVKSVVAAVASGETVVALLDEVFRGTNVHDASDATTALVRGLAHAASGVFAISSHLVEVADAIIDKSHVGFWHLEVSSSANGYLFTHRLVRGVSHVRLGMELLRREGVTDLLDQIAGRSPNNVH
ncbi:MAG: MutS-related protein [Gemmatimonas sp.]